MIEASIFSGTIHSFRYNYYYLLLVSRFLIRKKESRLLPLREAKCAWKRQLCISGSNQSILTSASRHSARFCCSFFCKEGRFGDAECSKQSQRVIQLCINVSPLSLLQ